MTTLNTAADLFLTHLKATGKSPATLRAYGMDLTWLLRRIGPDMVLADLTPHALEAIIAEEAVTRKAASLYRLKATLKSFFGWTALDGLIVSNPTRTLTLKRQPRHVPVYLTESERNRLLREVRDRSTSEARRDRAIIEIFLGTGIRLAELTNLDISDIDLDGKHLVVRSAKGGTPQVKFLKTDLRSVLRAFLTERRREGATLTSPLFASNRSERISVRQVADRVSHWSSKAGIDKDVTPHALRHTFATLLYGQGNDILLVQRALGHRSVETTQIYTHLADVDLEAAMERL